MLSGTLGQKAGMKDSLRTNRSGSVTGRLKAKQLREKPKVPAPLEGLLSNCILVVFVKVFPSHFVSEKISSTLPFKIVYTELLNSVFIAPIEITSTSIKCKSTHAGNFPS